MEVRALKLEGLVLLTPKKFIDDRGAFWETYRHGLLDEVVGQSIQFVQDNLSISKAGTLRGLHFQLAPHAQGKLVRVAAGSILDVAVDLRKASTTRGQWLRCVLSQENGSQLWVPPGFAHGFLALEDHTVVEYKCTAFYHPESEGAVRWDDPELNIDWSAEGFVMPESGPFVSNKDSMASSLSSMGWPF